MKKLLFVLFVFYSCTLFGQVKVKKKTIKDPIKGIVEEFYVLKKDQNVKHGEYKKTLRGNIVTIGNYKNGEKEVFKFYDTEMVHSYNFEEKKVLKYIEHPLNLEVYSTSLEKIDVERPPLPLFSPLELRYFIARNVKFPYEAREKRISGKPLIAVTISKEGEIKDFKVFKSAHKILDDAAISVLKMLDESWQWLPAKKDGKAIESAILIPVAFKVQ